MKIVIQPPKKKNKSLPHPTPLQIIIYLLCTFDLDLMYILATSDAYLAIVMHMVKSLNELLIYQATRHKFIDDVTYHMHRIKILSASELQIFWGSR